LSPQQVQAFSEIIARNRKDLCTEDLYILVPGLGEDVAIDGVPIYGSIAVGMADYPQGACIVMTRRTWERNLDTLAPLLAEICLQEIASLV
jgi:hypothetical protein